MHAKTLALSIAVLVLIACGGAVLAGEQNNNPQPLADDVILPMPNGRSMAFRPVCMGEGKGSYAWKRFRVGDPSGGYKESPTGVALGGAFAIQQGPGEDWCYYIGKYEVTEDQMFTLGMASKESENSDLPARSLSWFDAADFIRKYNEWLYENAQKNLPEYGGLPGYLRLPTEPEWEFAARGGSKVDGAQFDRRTPYPEETLAEFEWFSGPKSSHNKVKKIGALKSNPLGVHDLLGNVSEMTGTLYQIEYYQGRSGGFVAKGGHFLTDAKQLRSSLRIEQEFYALDAKNGKMGPGKKETLGFRLVIASLVFPNREVSSKMSDDWEAYRQGLAQSLPAAVSTSSTSAKTQVSGTDAATHLNRLREALAKNGALPGPVQQEIELLSSSLNDIQFTIKQAENDSAYAWIKIGGEQAYFIHKESKKLPILEELIRSAQNAQRTEVADKYKERETEIRQNIEQASSSYTESIRQLGAAGSPAVEDGFIRYSQFLKTRNADAQIRILEVVRRHAGDFLKNKRTEDEAWKKELLQPDQSKQ